MEVKSRRNRKWDILCAGELLVDCISEKFAETINSEQSYRMIPGGSPANLCMNMARLGNQCTLAACVGQDDMGEMLYQQVEKLGVNCEALLRVEVPSTLILVTRSKGVANFEAYRSADCMIGPAQFPDSLLHDTAIFHTTCFGLSKDPARSAILDAAQRAYDQGVQLSIDLNYASKIGPSQAEAQQMVAAYCTFAPLVKISEVDWERLYGQPFKEPEQAVQHFIDLGAALVCVTMGSEGCWIADTNEKHFLPSRPVKVLDTTGAGDAFWSGFLNAWLDGKAPLACAEAGREIAELKLGHFGPLPDKLYL